jgi:putative DNA primase/helicase
MRADKDITNSIRPTKRRRKESTLRGGAAPEPIAPSQPQDLAGGKSKTDAQAIPEEVRKKFTQVGNKYHFKDGALAFTDRGDRITSPSENTEVIKSIVSIAQARGWADITVTGTERFRRDAWYAARVAGLEVRGYQPTDFEQERLARTLARDSDSATTVAGDSAPLKTAPDRGPEREPKQHRDRLYLGRLSDHGPAPYRHDAKNSMSYFIRLETPDGERELWGIDLQRALKHAVSKPQIGDDIGVRAVRRDAVKVWAPEVDAEGQRIGEKRLETHRNGWIVETQGFFKDRAQAARAVRDPRLDQQRAVKRHPELVGTYLQLHAAELAARSIRDTQDQRRFVDSVRRALADSIARGEPLSPVRLKEPSEPVIATSAKTPLPVEREPAPTR